jgi:hypothetical protein
VNNELQLVTCLHNCEINTSHIQYRWLVLQDLGISYSYDHIWTCYDVWVLKRRHSKNHIRSLQTGRGCLLPVLEQGTCWRVAMFNIIIENVYFVYYARQWRLVFGCTLDSNSECTALQLFNNRSAAVRRHTVYNVVPSNISKLRCYVVVEITNTMHWFVPLLYSIYWLLHVSAVACHHQGAS